MGMAGESRETVREDYLDGGYLAKNPSFHVEDSPWKAAQIVRMMELGGLAAGAGGGGGEWGWGDSGSACRAVAGDSV